MRRKVLIAALCVLFLAMPAASIRNPSPITPFDSYGNICWEDEQARLDNFAIQLQQDPSLVGEIIVYAGRISCRDEASYRGNRAKKHVRKRGVNSDRVIFRDGGFQTDMQTVLSLRPRGKAPIELRQSLPKTEVSIRRCVDKVFARVVCLNSP